MVVPARHKLMGFALCSSFLSGVRVVASTARTSGVSEHWSRRVAASHL